MEDSSPMKGVERLTEELRLERQKSNQALQEKARVRIEVESSRQTIEQQKDNINLLQIEIAQISQKIHELESYNASLLQSESAAKDTIDMAHDKIAELEDTVTTNTQQLDEFRQQILLRDSIIHEQKIKLDTLERKSKTKDDLVDSLRQELQYFRQSQMSIQEEKESALHQANAQTALNEQLQSQLDLVMSLENGYNESLTSNTELREAFETSLQLNNVLNDQIRDLQARLNELTTSESMMTQHTAEITQHHNELVEELNQLHALHGEMMSSMQAEHDGREAAQTKADAAMRTRSFAETQAASFKSAHEESLQRILLLEKEVASERKALSDANEEVHKLREKSAQIDILQKQLATQQAQQLEIETLKSQSKVLRKKLMKADLDEQQANLGHTPQAILQREEQGRAIYESIITGLRDEVDKLSRAWQESVQREERAVTQASAADALRDELELLQETAQSLVEEKNTAQLASAEAAERCAKLTQERHVMSQQLAAANQSLYTLTKDHQRLLDDAQQLREKVKTLHSAKLVADKKSTETIAITARLEASLEEYKQQYDTLGLEKESIERAKHDVEYELENERARLSGLENLRVDTEDISKQLFALQQRYDHEKQIAQRTADMLRQELEVMRKELETMRKRQQSKQQALEQVQLELQASRNNAEDAANQRDRLRQELGEAQASRQAEAVASIQADLAQTMNDWQALETENSAKDTLIRQLQAEFAKEREKAVLLKMQVDLLEERNKVATQELAVYRGLDVYHSTMQAELSQQNAKSSKQQHAKESEKKKDKLTVSTKQDDVSDHDTDESSEIHAMPSPSPLASATSHFRSPAPASNNRFGYQGQYSAQQSTMGTSFNRQLDTSRLSLADITGPVAAYSALHSGSRSLQQQAVQPSRNSRTTSLAQPSGHAGSSGWDWDRDRERERTQLVGSGGRASVSYGDNSAFYRPPALSPRRSPASNSSPAPTDTSATEAEHVSRAELMRQRTLRRAQREKQMRERLLTEERGPSRSALSSSNRSGGQQELDRARRLLGLS